MQSTGAAGHVVSQIRAARRRPVIASVMPQESEHNFNRSILAFRATVSVRRYMPSTLQALALSFAFPAMQSRSPSQPQSGKQQLRKSPSVLPYWSTSSLHSGHVSPGW